MNLKVNEEYIAHGIAGLKGKPFSQHAEIRRWEYLQAKQWNFKVSTFKDIWLDIQGYYTPKYNHSNFGFKIIKHLPK
jgi:hypothetical protein